MSNLVPWTGQMKKMKNASMTRRRLACDFELFDLTPFLFFEKRFLPKLIQCLVSVPVPAAAARRFTRGKREELSEIREKKCGDIKSSFLPIRPAFCEVHYFGHIWLKVKTL